MDYVLRLASEDEGLDIPRKLLIPDSGGQHGGRWAGMYWLDEPIDQSRVTEAGERGATILDRSHLEAAATGLHPLAELIRDHFRRRQPHLPLAALLTARDVATEEWAMTSTTRLTSPPRVKTQTWAGVTAELLLIGQKQQDRPTGMATEQLL